MKKNLPLKILAGVCCLLAIAGCAASETKSAHVRIVNASPDAPPLDVFFDGELLEENLGYSEASKYQEIDVGRKDISVSPTLSKDSIIDISAEFEEGKDYTLVVSDVLSKIQMIVYLDDNTTPDLGDVKIRVINAAPSAPKVDIYLTRRGEDISDKDPSESNLSFTRKSRYFDKGESEYQIRATTAGTKTVIVDTGGFDLISGDIRTVLLLDVDGGGKPILSSILKDK